MVQIKINRFINNVSPVSFFVITALVFGLLFLLITPPFQGADEEAHFYRAYQISEGHFISDKSNRGIGGNLPVSLGQVVADTQPDKISFYPQNKYSERKTQTALSIHNDLQNETFYNFSVSAPYSPAAYFGPSLGIGISRLLNLPTLVALYAGRLGNLIEWMFLIGLAIYFVPRRKWAMVAVGLLPMALFQAATLNGDVGTLGSLILLLALVLNLREKKRPLQKKELAALLLTSIVMVLTKEIMFLFLPLLLLLKKDNFRSQRRAQFVKAGLIVLPLLCLLFWMFTIRGIDTTAAYNNHQNPAAQLGFIVHNPFSYVNVLWNTYFYTWGDGVTRSFIGTFGWADTPLSELIATIGYIGLAVLFIATYSNGPREWLKKKERMLLWSTLFLYWAAVNTALYLYYSPVGYKIVYGLQGRYFLPLAVVALPLLQSRLVKIDKILYRRIAIYLPLFLLISSTITIYIRYFVHNV